MAPENTTGSITELKAQIAEIEAMMQDPDFYSSAQEHL